MSSGPSKQELEMYWQNSRQYFDELAKHYQQADPQYYKEYIQPFYSNPFRSSSGGNKQGSGGAKLIVVMVFIAVIGIAVAGLIYFLAGSQELKPVVDKKESAPINKQNEKKQTEKTEPVEEVTEKSVNFRRGEKLFNDKNYKRAERYLKQVPKSDKNYEDAQRMLKELEELKKSENTDSRNNRNKPIQPVR